MGQLYPNRVVVLSSFLYLIIHLLAEDLQHTAIALQHLIKDHFEPLIQSLPHLKKWFGK